MSDHSNYSSEQNAGPAVRRNKPLAAVIIIFIVVVTFVLLLHRRQGIQWVTDYDAGIAAAERLNKPALLAFYKSGIRFCWLMKQNTYNNPQVRKFVEQNFVPIFIDVDKQPHLVKQYNVGYYPSHYLKAPRGDAIVGPRVGYDPPTLFIQQLRQLLESLKQQQPAREDR